MFENNTGNARFTWETLNKLMNRRCSEKLPNGLMRNGIEVVDDEEMANCFNDYFSSLPLQLDQNVPSSNLDPLNFVNPNITL